MNGKKRPPIDPLDPSLHPTRKVESMSSIAAELLLREQDGGLDEQTGRRLRSNRPPALDGDSDPAAVQSERWGAAPTGAPSLQGRPWRPSLPASTFAGQPQAPRQGPLRVALLVGGAVLLVLLSVLVTLLVTR